MAFFIVGDSSNGPSFPAKNGPFIPLLNGLFHPTLTINIIMMPMNVGTIMVGK